VIGFSLQQLASDASAITTLLQKTDLLVTGDRHLLALAGQTRFFIETPAAYRARVSGLQDDTFS
jgi:predicted nucleic acid-binding protein